MSEQFSFFTAPIRKHLKPTAAWTLKQAHEYITSAAAESITTQWRAVMAIDPEYKKEHFSAAVFTGLFSHRANKGLQQPSGLISLDIDHINQQGWKVEALKEMLLTDAELPTRLLFISPSGDGLKLVLGRPQELAHSTYFYALVKYFKQNYNISLDTGCKDIARACFLPFDPEAVYIDKPQELAGNELGKWLKQYGGASPEHQHKSGKAAPVADKAGLIGAFCKCYSIQEAIDAFLPDVYEATSDPNRYTYKNGSSWGGLWITPDGRQAFSFHNTDPANDGYYKNAFDLVRIHLFGKE